MISKEALVLIVRDQENEFKRLKYLVPREKIASIKEVKNTGAVVVKGIRRSGKSTLLKQIVSVKDDFLYFNFDDERAINFEVSDFQRLMEVFFEIYGKRKVLFFDEIQNIHGWELFINRMLRQDYSIYITGSNADLLSKELGTHLTGRHMDIELHPFSFREFLLARGIISTNLPSTEEVSLLNKQFKDYLSLGGMPECVLGKDTSILLQVVNDIIQKDIIRRYKIRKPNELKVIIHFLMSNISNKMTFRSISQNFNIKSANTVQKYFEYSEQTYLFFQIQKYEHKTKIFDKNPRKIYCMDTGIVSKHSIGILEQKGALLENLVAIELSRRLEKFFYYVTKNDYEVDFIVLPSGVKEKKLIQVCHDPANILTRQREERALVSAMDEIDSKIGLILTLDYELVKRERRKEIRYIPVWKWLLQEN